MDTITILGRQHVVTAPSYGLREEVCSELVMAQQAGDGMRCLRYYAAAVGLCCGVGKLAGASMARSSWDLLHYGDTVYSDLREQGASRDDVVDAGRAAVESYIDALFPREQEVADRVGFSEGGEGAQTSPPPA
jgi:hypothetical protein